MNVVDLHPEELLDKEASGGLSPEERTRLDAHLLRCEACRFERLARADFASELHAFDEELGLSAGKLALLVDAGTREQAVREPIEPAKPKELVTKRPRRFLRVALVAAVAMFVGGVASASEHGIGGKLARWVGLFSTTEARSPLETRPLARAPSQASTVEFSATTTPSGPDLAELDTFEATSPAAELDAEKAEKSEFSDGSRVHGSRREAGTGHGERHRIADAKSTHSERTSSRTEGAAALFDAAQVARLHGDHDRALSLAAELQSRYPTSREAHVSYAASGRLLLDRGDAAAALSNFDKYRALGPGELEETVVAGRAVALERLGRQEESKQAWRSLLEKFPGSAYAAHARARLDANRR